MPAKLPNRYIITDTVCALILPRKAGSVTAIFDTKYLDKVQRYTWTYSGEIIQSTNKIALSKLLGDSIGSHRRKEWNDDFTEANFIKHNTAVGVRLVLEKLRSWNTKFHKQVKGLPADAIVRHKVLLVDSSIVEVTVRNRDSFLIPTRATMHNGRLCLLKSDDTVSMSVQKSFIEKLDLPIFADYELADPLNLTVVNELNFIGKGTRCEIEDTELPSTLRMILYAEAEDMPIEFTGRSSVSILFDETALSDVMQYRWTIYDKRIVAAYSAFNSQGVMVTSRFQLARFLAECYNLDIGPYVIPSRTTRILSRLNDSGDTKNYRKFVSRAINNNSSNRKRDPFATKAKSFQYHTVQFRQCDIETIGTCYDMRINGLQIE